MIVLYVLCALWATEIAWLAVAYTRNHRHPQPDPAPAAWAHIDTRPLDERDVDLWAAQFQGPEANEQIDRELEQAIADAIDRELAS